ncbi:MAG: hypothetical protein ABIR94_15520 [Rubrivivax sp.]
MRNSSQMPDFDDSTLWRISAYERMRLQRSGSVFAPLDDTTVLPTTMVAELHHLDNPREGSDVLEVLAACVRHRQTALLCLRYDQYVWPVTVFPTDGVYHSPRDMSLASEEGLGAVRLVSCEPTGLRAPGHWMHERIGRPDHYRPLKSLLWSMALVGPRGALLKQISGHAAYRSTLSDDMRPATPGALASAADRLRRETAPVRDMARWPGMSVERACRLLNALYLASGLIVMRTHHAARDEPQTLAGRLGIGKTRR